MLHSDPLQKAGGVLQTSCTNLPKKTPAGTLSAAQKRQEEEIEVRLSNNNCLESSLP
jgi:hypothetical protein